MSALDRWLLAPAPAARLAALRILVGGYALLYLLIRTPAFLQTFDLPVHRFEAVGPLAWLGDPVAPALARVLFGAAILAGVAFVAGWRFRIVGPAFALLFLALTTYRVSWGNVLHTDNLPALHLLILGFSPAADAGERESDRYGWPIRVMALVTVLSYFLAGIAKFRYGGTEWLGGDVLRNQVAYDNLRKVLLGDIHSPLGGWLVQHGWVFAPLAWFTLVVELGAPVALRGGRLRTGWVASAWAFHLGIVALMAINFPYELCGVAFAPFFRVERLVGYVRRRLWPRRLLPARS